MAQQVRRHEITLKPVLYTIPGVETVTIRRDVPFRIADGEALTMDIYYPPGASTSTLLPAVVFVIGFSDVGARAMLGCAFKEMESYVGWAKLVAASGVAAITYANREPAADLGALLAWLRADAAPLGLDGTRVGLWACSGNVPLALWALMQDGAPRPACAALCYGYTLDLGGTTSVAEAAATFRFANPCQGKTVEDLPPDVPLFVARAGRDEMPGLNDALDRFLARAVQRNLPVTFVNHAAGPHAFDLADGSRTTREIIGGVLTFVRTHLL